MISRLSTVVSVLRFILDRRKGKEYIKNIIIDKSTHYHYIIEESNVYKTILAKEPTYSIQIIPELEQEPKIELKVIGSKKIKDWVRVCLVQLDFSVEYIKSRTEFGYILTDKKIIRKKIFDALEIAKTKDVNIICFPELSIVEDWIEEVKNQYHDMITVFGTYYSDSFNICPVIANGEIYNIRKINPSPTFETKTGPSGGMKSGDKILIFHTNYGRFVVLICWDYIEEGYRFLRKQNEKKKMIDYIIVPEYNEDIEYFQKTGDIYCRKGNFPYILQINAWKIDGQEVGGTCVIGMEHREMLKRYENEGKKPCDNIKYKLIQKEKEHMLIVDLDIKRKGVPIPASGPKMVLEEYYQYEDGGWKIEK